LKDDYKMVKILGKGTFGTVVKAVNRKTKAVVAIKYINGISKNSYSARKVLREVKIMRKLSQIKENVFTVKLLDIIIPKSSLFSESERD
jgi:serine/threonine protein kinase